MSHQAFEVKGRPHQVLGLPALTSDFAFPPSPSSSPPFLASASASALHSLRCYPAETTNTSHSLFCQFAIHVTFRHFGRASQCQEGPIIIDKIYTPG